MGDILARLGFNDAGIVEAMLRAWRLLLDEVRPDLIPGYRGEIGRLGLKVEDSPVPFAEVSRRSRMIVSHGGHGTICSAMMAGLPQIVCHYDLEKKLNGRAVTRAGLGVLTPLVSIKPELFAAAAVQVYRDEALAARARAAAGDLRARYPKTMP